MNTSSQPYRVPNCAWNPQAQWECVMTDNNIDLQYAYMYMLITHGIKRTRFAFQFYASETRFAHVY